MKIALCEHHGFKLEYVEMWQWFLNKELTPEEVLKHITQCGMMPVQIVDDVVYVIHPQYF